MVDGAAPTVAIPATRDLPRSSTRSALGFAVGGHRAALVRVAALAFAGGLAEAFFLVVVTRSALAVTNGADQVGMPGRDLPIGAALGVAFGLVVLRVVMSGCATWQSAQLSTTVVANVRARLVQGFLRSAWEVQQNERTGSLQQLVSSYSNQTAGLMGSLGQGIVATANLVALLGLAIGVDPIGAAAMLVSVALLGVLLRPIRGAIGGRSRRAAHANMELATAVSELSQLGMELHVFHAQQQAEQRIQAHIDNARHRSRALAFVTGSSSNIYTGMAYVALLGALAVVSASPDASLDSLGAVMLLMLRSLSYGQALQSAHAGISSDAPVVEELRQRLLHFEANQPPRGGRAVGAVGPIEARDVTFEYLPGQPVLRDLSFVIEPREIVGVVGPSGSGKSTVVQLLLGLRDPQAGQILADGRDIRSFDGAEWARKVTLVPQDAHLISGTVAENIRFLRDGVTAADVEQAARLAHLHDEIVAARDGYDRWLGAGGGRLSGGQQQRLCIARALVERPDAIILDEPTSALDVRSEQLIRTTLLGLKEHMTVIVIAHRLTTLDICDRLMVIQDGRLVAFDSPTNLERSSEFYRDAIRLSGLH